MTTVPVDQYVRQATVDRWYDGDSGRLRIDYGYRQSGLWWGRLVTARGPGLDAPYVDAPELRPLQSGAPEALAFVRGLAPAGTPVTTRSWSEDPETLGRYLMTVWTPDGTDIAQALIDAGHIKPGSTTSHGHHPAVTS